jgi:drug/metabolite transporter (DMT)-like permease
MYNPVLIALSAAFLFGAATPFSKILLASLPPFQLAGLLYLGAAAGVFLVLMARRDSLGLGAGLSRKNALRLVFAILCGGVCGPVFLLKGLQLAPAGSVSLWLVLEMVLTALLGHWFFKDHLGLWGWVGAAGCLAGSVLLSIGEGGAGFKAGAWVTLACLAWGMDNHLTALIDGLKPLQTTYWKGLAAGSITLSAGLLHSPAPPSGRSVSSGLLLGALSYGASMALYIRSAQSLGATRSQMVFSSAPFFGLLLAFCVLGEIPTWLQGLSAAVFIASIALVFRDKHAHAHKHAATMHLHAHRHDDGHHYHTHPGKLVSLNHSHPHSHEPLEHAHPHWPDIHHRHTHHN